MKDKLFIPLRVKNAILFIQEWLNCYERLADGIVVVDNGSDDGTYEILKAHPLVLEITRTEGFNEGRDFQLLLDMLRKYSPDWILVVDADEVFEERLTRQKLHRLKTMGVSHYTFRRFHMFNDRSHYMAPPGVLKSYCAFGDRSMFRFSERLYVPQKQVHTSIMGRPKFFFQSDYRILHLSFLYPDYRKKLYDNYLNIDTNPNNIKTYQRDLEILQNSPKTRVLPFQKGLVAIKLEYHIYNLLALLNSTAKKLKSISIR